MRCCISSSLEEHVGQQEDSHAVHVSELCNLIDFDLIDRLGTAGITDPARVGCLLPDSWHQSHQTCGVSS